MAFRDESEALRARVDVLERELAEALRKIEEREPLAAEREALTKRVEELEDQLGHENAKKRTKEKAKRAQEAHQAREERKRAETAAEAERLREGRAAKAAGTGGSRTSQWILGATILVAGIGTAAWMSGAWGGSAVSADAVPSLGVIDLDATPQPATVRLRTTGTSSAPGSCSGYLPDAPQLVLRTSRPTTVRIAPVAVSGDLVMVLLTADGQTLCDDDGGGSLNPLISTVLPPGDSRLIIGTYGEDTEIELSLSMIARSQDPIGGSTAGSGSTTGSGATGGSGAVAARLDGPDANGSYDGLVLPITEASTLDASCRGYLPSEPQLRLHLTGDAAVNLHASGSSDLVMLVLAPDGSVKCDDDSGNGNEPQIATLLGAGDHDVWVGTYSATDQPAAYHLEASAHRVDPGAPPILGARTLAGAESAITVEGTSTGEIGPSALGASCPAGLVGVRPHVTVEIDAYQDVVLALAGEGAPFAVIEHPDRNFECVGTARTRAHWQPGVHRIFVGVAQESHPGEFTLTVERQPASVQSWTPLR